MIRSSKCYKVLFSLILACVLFCSFFLVACSDNEDKVYVIDIEKTGTSGFTDIYTITYSDGKTSEFSVKNGQDGEDKSDITIVDIYNEYKLRYGEISYHDFVGLYLGGEDAVSTVVNYNLLSAIKVYGEFYTTQYVGFGPFVQEQKDVGISGGSAVIYKIEQDYTYIITNYHVVYNKDANSDNGGKIAKNIYGYVYGSEDYPLYTETVDSKGYPIYNYGESAIKLEYIGGSVNYDLALLKVETSAILALNSDIKAINFASDYVVGQTAVAIGNTEDQGTSVTKGIVSVASEYISLAIDNTQRFYRVMRIDTASYSGNSGGGLYNVKGELIGITNAGDQVDQNVNFAIPCEVVKNVIDNIYYYHNDGNNNTQGVFRLNLNTSYETQNAKYVYDTQSGIGRIQEDIVVTNVDSGCVGDIMGLVAGDKIVKITINNVDYVFLNAYQVDDILLNIRAGDEISFSYIRDSDLNQTNNYIVKSENLIKMA